MIISASRRTDIPAFFTDWFINRLKDGYVLVPNPKSSKRLSHINLSPQIVDCIVFWTKNPIPIFDKLDIIDDLGYKYYFQFTLTPYGKDIEQNLPDKLNLLNAFIRLSEKIGENRVIWRYDPIILNSKYNLKWHIKNFSYLCNKLKGKTKICVFSFLDIYNNIKGEFQNVSDIEVQNIAKYFSAIAKDNNITLKVCGEKYNLENYGIKKATCISKKIIEDITGYKINTKKDINQRKLCNCIQSIDIGAYNTCKNGCSYCYANNNLNLIYENELNFDVNYPILTGSIKGNEIIKKRVCESNKINQISFFDY